MVGIQSRDVAYGVCVHEGVSQSAIYSYSENSTIYCGLPVALNVFIRELFHNVGVYLMSHVHKRPIKDEFKDFVWVFIVCFMIE